jgi:hypothetical protein
MTHPGARFVNYNMIDSLFILTNYNSNMVTITLSKTLEKSIIYINKYIKKNLHNFQLYIGIEIKLDIFIKNL